MDRIIGSRLGFRAPPITTSANISHFCVKPSASQTGHTNVTAFSAMNIRYSSFPCSRLTIGIRSRSPRHADIDPTRTMITMSTLSAFNSRCTNTTKDVTTVPLPVVEKI